MDVAALTQADVESQEAELAWPGSFGAEEALELGLIVCRLARGYERGVSARIFREPDGLLLFGWSMDDKTPKNDGYIDWKRRTALACGHSSLWAGLEPDGAAGAGIGAAGAFPIRLAEDGCWVATLVVSGLHDGADHELVVRALSEAVSG